MQNKLTAQDYFILIGLIAFATLFCLVEHQWIADQWKTWGCLIRVCLSPFAVIAIAAIVTAPFRN